MNCALGTIEDLYHQCSGRHAAPAFIHALTTDLTAHVKSTHILSCVLNQVLPVWSTNVKEGSMSMVWRQRQRRYQQRGIGWQFSQSGSSFLDEEGGVVSCDVDDIAALCHSNAGNPFFRVVVQTVAAHVEQFHDGGWGLAYLTARLTRRLRWLSSDTGMSSSSTATVPRSMNVIETWINELMQLDVSVLEHLGVTRRLRSSDDVSLFVRSALRLDGYIAAQSVTRIVDCIKESLTLCASSDDGRFFPKRIVFDCCCSNRNMPILEQEEAAAAGAAVKEECCDALPRVDVRIIRGLFIEWQMPLEAQLLFEGNLLQKKRILSSSSSPTMPCLLLTDAIDDVHWDELWKIIRTIVPATTQQPQPQQPQLLRRGGEEESDVTLIVACQRTISPRIKYLLYQQRIVALERLSIRHIDHFRMVSGAKVVSNVHELAAILAASSNNDISNVLGKVLSMEADENSRYRTLVRGVPQMCETHTVQLTSDDGAMLHLIQEQAHHALQALCALFSKGAFVVRGGGGWESFVGQYLWCRWLNGESSRSSSARSTTSDVVEQRPSKQFIKKTVEEVCGGLFDVADTFVDSSNDNKDTDATTTPPPQRAGWTVASQVAAFAAKNRRMGCQDEPTESDDQREWKGLQPLLPSEFIQATTSLTSMMAVVGSRHDEWCLVDSLWNKKESFVSAWGVSQSFVSTHGCVVER